MRRLLALLLALSFVLPCVLTSCNNDGSGNTNNDSENGGNSVDDSSNAAENLVSVTEDFVIAYNPYDVVQNSLAKRFAEDFEEKYDLKLSSKDFTVSKAECEIQLGFLTSRAEYKQAVEFMDQYATPGIGVALIRANERGLLITGSTNNAVKVAIDYAYTNVFGLDGSYDKQTDELIIFDARAYSEKKEVIGYTIAKISSFADVYAFSVGGKELDGFSPEVHEYTVNVTFADGYPDISVTPLSKNAIISYDPPTDENNGIGTVTVTSADGSDQNVYKINVNMNYSYATEAEIVNKGGAAAVVSFVIDDGDQTTASFVTDKMFKRYPELRATFAVKVKDLATVRTTSDASGNESYLVDADGRYVYTANQSNVDFWKDVLETGRADVVSHSYSHTYWGENDDGGSFVYTKNDGTTATSRVFPRGTVTMELKASAQIVRELLGIDAYTFIKPGVGAKLSQYYFDLLESCGTYIGARGTNSSPSNPKAMVNLVSDFANPSKRFNVKSYMIEHYATSKKKVTDINSEPFECLTADIDYWMDYIDSAIANGGFACFCIHDIEANDYVGANHHIYQAQADMLFSYACEKDNLWIATFDEAVIYYSEWSTASVSAIAYKNESITVRLTDEENDEIYDLPLTVKVKVPSEWYSVTVTQGDATASYEVIHSDGESYAFVDVTPDKGDALVTPLGE